MSVCTELLLFFYYIVIFGTTRAFIRKSIVATFALRNDSRDHVDFERFFTRKIFGLIRPMGVKRTNDNICCIKMIHF